jgi:hypothetical protein
MATGPIGSNVVSYLGELFQTSKRPNTLLKLLGGFQGGITEASSKEFPIGVFFNLRTPSQPANLEGANAPTPQYRSFTQATNVIQIFQEAVSLSYLAQSDKTVSGIVPIPQARANGEVLNPRSEAFQVLTAIETIAQDLNYSMLNGVFANPANPQASALQMRGILTAIVTNINDQSGAGAPSATTYRSFIEATLADVIQTSGFQVDDTWTLFAGVNEYANAQAAFAGVTTPPYDREVAGLKLRQLYTKFGILNLVLDPDMPAQTLGIFNLGVAGLVGLPVPAKGILFEEPLFKQGSADQTQIYGQLSIDHGPEFLHGLLKVPVVSL